MDFKELSNLQIDALKEIGNIGAGNAATALAQMINTKVDMNVPQISILAFGDVPELVGGADNYAVGIYLNVSGKAATNILFLMEVDKACFLVDMLMGRSAGSTRPDSLSELEISAMMEVGNIISATYLNALSMFTQLSFVPSVPALAIDMAGAILGVILAEYGQVGDSVLLLDTLFKKDDQDVVGHFFLLPEPGALDTILSALGVSF